MNNLKFRVWDKKLQITGTVSNKTKDIIFVEKVSSKEVKENDR